MQVIRTEIDLDAYTGEEGYIVEARCRGGSVTFRQTGLTYRPGDVIDVNITNHFEEDE